MLKKLVFYLLLFVLFTPQTSHAQEEKRNFLMGFSPWPYDFSLEAVEWTYKTINDYGDVVSHHLEEGVPWDEALYNKPFSQSYTNDLNYRLQHVNRDHKIVLQLNPLDIKRANLAPHRGEKANEPLPSTWTNKTLNDPDVKKAYVRYIERMDNLFKPDYLLTGIEVNLILRNNPKIWKDYVELQCHVYKSLKKKNQNKKIYVSVFAASFLPEWVKEDKLEEHVQALKDLSPCTDGFALSVHPFMSALLADSFPDNYFDRLSEVIPHIVGISESSYTAQKWTLMWMVWNGTQEKQDHFLSLMLNAAQKQKMEFVIWYAPRDYDAMWKGVLGRDSLALIWRDTGLFDENGTPRTALTTWQKALKKNKPPLK